ncbi:tetratricopeptide repeat protein [Pseudoxanthomonas suwonensis]|uniref:Uncharacterized protein n=1 Tax=Pseudoxanthomonas suwonensis TaxID=314722 RepID=A0A0E3Z1Z0_9GAMM|nr:tetratricopeptide repeat protein [Pseudoxanthomonas suwonensis]AKC87028.1 hypothetical protein WQ53_10020 [Pseudoxanthomonas suwonensis]
MHVRVWGLLASIGLLLPVGAAIGSGISAGYEESDPIARKLRKETAQTPFQQQLGAAVASFQQGDHAGSERLLKPLIADPGFGRLPGEQRHAALALSALNALLMDDPKRARKLFLRAIEAEPGHATDPYFLSLIAAQQGRYEDAARRLTEAVRLSPTVLGDLETEDHFVYQLLHELDDDAPVRLGLLQGLFDAEWDRGGLGADDLWYELALLRVKRGETALAGDAVARIGWPDLLVKLRSDRRFDPLVDRQSPRFDVERAARTHVDALRSLAGERPSSLKVRTDLTYAMLTLGLDQEVLDETGSILDTLAAATPEQAPYEDTADYQAWILNNHAIALRRTDRIDEAVELLVRASRLDEWGTPNVSQVLNLGAFYCSLGRADDARATIAAVGGMSGYGRMVQASIQHCVAWQAGDRAGAAKALAYLRKQRDDSPMHGVYALVREDRIDEAARALAGLLESGEHRADALAALQDYPEPEPLPGDRESFARWNTLKDHPAVRQVAERVGRIERYGIHYRSGM